MHCMLNLPQNPSRAQAMAKSATKFTKKICADCVPPAGDPGAPDLARHHPGMRPVRLPSQAGAAVADPAQLCFGVHPQG
eukprot:1160451-Pelagomonas_calceolata.AAC.2